MENHPLTRPEPLTTGSAGQGDLEKSLPNVHSPSAEELWSTQVFWESQGIGKILQPLKRQHRQPLPLPVSQAWLWLCNMRRAFHGVQQLFYIPPPKS